MVPLSTSSPLQMSASGNVPSVSTTSVTTTTPLRRAVYVHVSDLTESYNIDPKKLLEEISKVANPATEKKEVAVPKGENKENKEIPGVDDIEYSGRTSGVSLSGLRISSESGESGGIVEKIQQQQHQKRLHPPRGGFNLCVLVGSVNVVVDKLRVDRSRVRLAEVEVGDETGTVSLRARDEQIDVLKEVSDRSGAVVLRNCTLELYQGRHLRLAVTKWGKLSPYPDQVASTPSPPLKMNKELNYSLVDLSLVARDVVSTPSPVLEGVATMQQRVQSSAMHHGDEGGSSSSTGSKQQLLFQQQQMQGFQQQHHHRHRGREKKQQQQYRHSHKTGGTVHSQPRLAYQDGSPVGMATTVFPPMATFTPVYTEGVGITHYTYPASPLQRQQESQRHHHHVSQQQRREQQHELQQRLLLQHYELQQRQIQQMHMYQEQQEQHRRMFERHHQQSHQMHQQPPSVMVPEILRTGSIDSGEYSSTSMGGNVGTNPVLLPVSMASSSVLGNAPPQSSMSSHAETQHQHQQFSMAAGIGAGPGDYQSTSATRGGHVHNEGASTNDARMQQHRLGEQPTSPSRGGMGGRKIRAGGGRGGTASFSQAQQGGRNASAAAGMLASTEEEIFGTQQTDQHLVDTWRDQHAGTMPSLQVARADSPPPSPGRMNPQATSFAPSFVKTQAVIHPSHQVQSSAYAYVPFDPNQAASGGMYGSPTAGHQHAMYAQGVVYVPAVQGAAGGNLGSVPVSQSEGGGVYGGATSAHHASGADDNKQSDLSAQVKESASSVKEPGKDSAVKHRAEK